jgi:hypothetical protein
MYWTQEPTVVPVHDPADGSRVIALVGLVGLSPTGPSNNVAIALSLDGGQTWNDSKAPPQLLFDYVITDPIGLDDLAVTAGGHYDQTGNNYLPLYNTGTYDIYATWWEQNHRWFDVVSFRDGHWKIFHRFSTPTDLVTAAPAIFNSGGRGLPPLFMSIVSGFTQQAPGIEPFVMVEWPFNSDDTVNSLQAVCPIDPTAFRTMSWHVAVSYDYGTTWQPAPDSHPGAQVPDCVGAGYLVNQALFRDVLRSSLAFDPNSMAVIDAVAMWDSFDAVPGTYIEANAFDFTMPIPPPPQPLFHTTHVDTQPRQDQFLPVVAAALGTGGTQGYVSLAWVDSVDDPSHENVPSGLYGVTSQNFSIGTPGFSGVTRAWPDPLAPAAFMATPYPDTLGRHNSMSVLGFSWLSFTGDYYSIGHESMDTASISPL